MTSAPFACTIVGAVSDCAAPFLGPMEEKAENMRRSVLATALGTLSIGLASMVMLPAAAQATTTSGSVCTPPTANVRQMKTQGEISGFTGCTYPDTSAGLAACQAMGVYEVQSSRGEIFSYSCPLGDPDVGVYNLWTHSFVG